MDYVGFCFVIWQFAFMKFASQPIASSFNSDNKMFHSNEFMPI